MHAWVRVLGIGQAHLTAPFEKSSAFSRCQLVEECFIHPSVARSAVAVARCEAPKIVRLLRVVLRQTSPSSPAEEADRHAFVAISGFWLLLFHARWPIGCECIVARSSIQ